MDGLTNRKFLKLINFLVFFLLVWVMDVLPTTHLVWTGRSGAQGSFWSLVYSTVFFASVRVESWIAKISRRSYRPVHQFIKSITQGFQVHRVHLATGHVDIKQCAVTKGFCIYCLTVVSASNLLNQIYNNCKFKIFTVTKQNVSYSNKIASSSKILNTNQMLISYILSIQYNTFPDKTANWIYYIFKENVLGHLCRHIYCQSVGYKYHSAGFSVIVYQAANIWESIVSTL